MLWAGLHQSVSQSWCVVGVEAVRRDGVSVSKHLPIHSSTHPYLLPRLPPAPAPSATNKQHTTREPSTRLPTSSSAAPSQRSVSPPAVLQSELGRRVVERGEVGVSDGLASVGLQFTQVLWVGCLGGTRLQDQRNDYRRFVAVHRLMYLVLALGVSAHVHLSCSARAVCRLPVLAVRPRDQPPPHHASTLTSSTGGCFAWVGITYAV